MKPCSLGKSQKRNVNIGLRPRKMRFGGRDQRLGKDLVALPLLFSQKVSLLISCKKLLHAFWTIMNSIQKKMQINTSPIK